MPTPKLSNFVLSKLLLVETSFSGHRQLSATITPKLMEILPVPKPL